MTDDKVTFARVVVFLALIMTIAGLMGPTPGAWANMQNLLSNPPAFPGSGAANPYGLNAATVTLPIIANATWGYDSASSTFGNNAVSPPTVFTDGSDPNCGAGSHVTGNTSYPGEYWECLTTNDGNSSGVSLSGIRFINSDGVTIEGYTFAVMLGNITGIDLQDQIMNVTVSASCNSNSGTPITFTADFIQTVPQKNAFQLPYLYPQAVSMGQATPIGNATCAYGGAPGPFGSVFYNVTDFLDYQNGIYVSNQRLQNISGSELLISTTVFSASLQISYLNVVVTYLNEHSSSLNAACNTFDIGCQVGKIWNAAVGTLLPVINGAIYFISWGIYIVQLVTSLILSILEILFWLLTSTGAPPIAQAIIDVFVLGMISYVLIYVASLILGARP